MMRNDDTAFPAGPIEWLVLRLTADRVLVEGTDGPVADLGADELGRFLAANPDVRFVVEDGGALFGWVLSHENKSSNTATWEALNENRVVDVTLADELLRLAQGHDQAAGPRTESVLARGKRFWEEMVRTAERHKVLTHVVKRYGPLGHGLRVRAAAAFSCLTQNGIHLAPESRRALIAECQQRVETLSAVLQKADQRLGPFLGRARGTPEKLIDSSNELSKWLAVQLRNLRDAHWAPIYPFLELTNEEFVGAPEAWPVWALGVPHVSTLIALIAAARLWRDLNESGDGPLRPRFEIVPRLRAATCNLEALPRAGLGHYAIASDGALLVPVSFRRLVLAAVAFAAQQGGYRGPLLEGLEHNGDPLQNAREVFAAELAPSPRADQFGDWFVTLIQYTASGASPDGIKEFVETVTGFTTECSSGDYMKIRSRLCEEVLPELGSWLADRLAERVEQALPNPPAPGTLRRMISQPSAAALSEGFANPSKKWGPFYRLLDQHGELGFSTQRLLSATPVKNFRSFCTEKVISPSGTVRPHLPWAPARAESWRMPFDEVVLNVVARLTAAGYSLGWASERGIWLHFSSPSALETSAADINSAIALATREILGDVPCLLQLAIGPANLK